MKSKKLRNESEKNRWNKTQGTVWIFKIYPIIEMIFPIVNKIANLLGLPTATPKIEPKEQN